MRLVLIFYFLTRLFTISYGQCPTERDFVEIGVRSGVTIYGSESVKLLYEGLIYRWTDENFKKKSCFICLDSLNNKKLCELQNYVWENGLKDLEEKDLTTLDSNIINFDRPKIIYFMNLRDNKLHSLKYVGGDDRIKKLIIMLIELIPQEHSDYFKRVMLR